MALLLFLLAALPSLGATGEPPAFEFRVVAWNRDLPGVFYLEEGTERPLPLRRGNITASHALAGAGPLVLHMAQVVDGERRRVTLVEAPLHPPPKKNLVVVWVDRAGRHRATVLADEPGRPGGGQVRFVNSAGRRLALNAGERTLILEPGGEEVVEAGRGGLGLKVAVEVEEHGGWRLALMNGLRVRPDERVTVFIANPGQLALAPEEEDKELRVRPLSLFVIRDAAADVATDG